MNDKVLSNDAVIPFTRQFGGLLDAGLKIVDALVVVAGGTPEGEFQKALFGVRSAIQYGGAPLSEGLRRYPGYFGPMYQKMVRAGEVKGTVREIIPALAIFMEMNMVEVPPELAEMADLVRSTALLSAMLSAETPLPEAILAARNACTTNGYVALFQGAFQPLRESEGFTEVFKGTLMPDMAIAMIAHGEDHGELNAAFLKVAQFYLAEFYREMAASK